MPSAAGKRAKVFGHHVVLPLPLLERDEGHALLLHKRVDRGHNALLIGSISAEKANGCPRCRRENAATPLW